MGIRIQEAVNPPAILAGYGGGDRPLVPYAWLASVWMSGLVGFLTLARALGKPMPRFSAGDIALLSGATFHLSRVITKDSILSFMRAPFTRFKESGAPGETNEEPRKENELQHAIGELVSCPFCMATWVAAALIYSWTFFPAVTRMVAGLFSIVGLADALQLAYGVATREAK